MTVTRGQQDHLLRPRRCELVRNTVHRTTINSPSVNDFASFINEFEMRYVEALHGFQRQFQGLIVLASSLATQILSQLTQRAQDTRPIEPLTLTVITEAHAKYDNRLAADAATEGGSIAQDLKVLRLQFLHL